MDWIVLPHSQISSYHLPPNIEWDAGIIRELPQKSRCIIVMHWQNKPLLRTLICADMCKTVLQQPDGCHTWFIINIVGHDAWKLLAVEHFNFQIYHISVLVPSDGCRDLINWLTLISLLGITRKFKIKDFWILCTEMDHCMPFGLSWEYSPRWKEQWASVIIVFMYSKTLHFVCIH